MRVSWGICCGFFLSLSPPNSTCLYTWNSTLAPNNAPATFQHLMAVVLRGLTPLMCRVYLDDIIIFSTTFEEHVKRLRLVLSRLREAGLKLKPRKCRLLCEHVRFLGHMVSEQGVSTDPEKVRAIAKWPTPTCVKDVRSFLGMAGHYRRFVRIFRLWLVRLTSC